MRLPTPPTKREKQRTPAATPPPKPPPPAPIHFTVARSQPRFKLFKAASLDYDEDDFFELQPREQGVRATRSVLFDPIHLVESEGAARFDSVLTDAGHEEDVKVGLNDATGGYPEDNGGYSELDNGVYKKKKRIAKNGGARYLKNEDTKKIKDEVQKPSLNGNEKHRTWIEEQFTGTSIAELLAENLANGKMFEAGNRVLWFCGEEERWRDASAVVRLTVRWVPFFMIRSCRYSRSLNPEPRRNRSASRKRSKSTSRRAWQGSYRTQSGTLGMSLRRPTRGFGR